MKNLFALCIVLFSISTASARIEKDNVIVINDQEPWYAEEEWGGALTRGTIEFLITAITDDWTQVGGSVYGRNTFDDILFTGGNGSWCTDPSTCVPYLFAVNEGDMINKHHLNYDYLFDPTKSVHMTLYTYPQDDFYLGIVTGKNQDIGWMKLRVEPTGLLTLLDSVIMSKNSAIIVGESTYWVPEPNALVLMLLVPAFTRFRIG
jgi:hypothetical protein